MFLVNIQSDGVSLYVNEKQETLKLEVPLEVTDFNMSDLTACLTDLKLNSIPLVDTDQHMSLEAKMRGAEYSLSTCPQ